jgi:hypothetical protein
MSKDKANKTAPKPAVAKKGMVRDRSRNRTIDQSRKASEPKWENTGGGVLTRVIDGRSMGPGSRFANPIRLEGPGGFGSVKYEPTLPPAEETQWIKVGQERAEEDPMPDVMLPVTEM